MKHIRVVLYIISFLQDIFILANDRIGQYQYIRPFNITMSFLRCEADRYPNVLSLTECAALCSYRYDREFYCLGFLIEFNVCELCIKSNNEYLEIDVGSRSTNEIMQYLKLNTLKYVDGDTSTYTLISSLSMCFVFL